MGEFGSASDGALAMVVPLPGCAPRAPVRSKLLLLLFLAGGTSAFQLLDTGTATSPDPSPAEATRRQLSSGEVVGFVGRDGAYTWLGLPYARPPVGERRWRAPEPPDPWRGTRRALAFGAACTQFASPLGGFDADAGSLVGSEDCLTLNVWAPPDADGLPVMLWVHGGSNVMGHGGFYDGSRLAVSQRVVVITVNYRLGPFGWFRHPALADGADARDRSGNFGTLDLVRALEWVQENAAAVGGDPARVTLFGESAGGNNVVTLLVAPSARGLFHRAIVQSGTTFSQAPSEGENPVDADPPGHRNSSHEVLLRLLVADGSAADAGAARKLLEAWGAGRVRDYLRSLSSQALYGAYREEGAGHRIDPPRLFRDGTVLPTESPYALLGRPGGFHPVPVIFGTNRDEWKLFLALDPQEVRMVFGLPLWRYEPVRYETRSDYLSRVWKAEFADELARRVARVRGPGSVWVYRFDWDEEPTILWSDLSQLLGAAHGFEIPFVFGRWDLGERGNIVWSRDNESGREELARRMMAWWANFARSGDPGPASGGLRWESWDPDRPRFLVLDTEADGGRSPLLGGAELGRPDPSRARGRASGRARGGLCHAPGARAQPSLPPDDPRRVEPSPSRASPSP